jgi:hypothetical protein
MLNGDELKLENAWKRIGFLQYSPEYWLLGNAIVNRLLSAGMVESLPGTTVMDAAPLRPILGDYDQTSMRQVNDLIAGFQEIRL